MEPKPVQHNQQPAYPTRREVLAGAAAFALSNLAGRSFVFAESETGEITVAPVFAHGEGRGAVGCIVVSPPVFLSEEEGMQVLREELAKHGVELKAADVLKDVRVRSRIAQDEDVDKGEGKTELKESIIDDPERVVPLKLDGFDPTKRIAVEFISLKDYYRVGGPLYFSTLQGYDFKETAEYLAGQVKKQGKDRIFFGVFYDPLVRFPEAPPHKIDEKVDWETVWKKQREQGAEEAKKLLRQQAQDFIAWLKERKAID